ncbi:MAG: metal-dependent transcriptional regulator [Candidatus Glassbacteria bacterium]
MKSEAIEDYLKAIYKIQREDGRVSTSMLARSLSVTPASASAMIKKLAKLGLVVHRPYRGVILTRKGQKIAMTVLRQHRLLELYLVHKMGLPWDKVHAEADKLEHALSEDLEDRIDLLLGHPATDPHGAPIPDRDGSVTEWAIIRLSDLVPGQSATVSEIEDHDPELLRYAASKGLLPKTRISVRAIEPFDGPITVFVGGSEYSIGREAACCIYVTDIGINSQ